MHAVRLQRRLRVAAEEHAAAPAQLLARHPLKEATPTAPDCCVTPRVDVARDHRRVAAGKQQEAAVRDLCLEGGVIDANAAALQHVELVVHLAQVRPQVLRLCLGDDEAQHLDELAFATRLGAQAHRPQQKHAHLNAVVPLEGLHPVKRQLVRVIVRMEQRTFGLLVHALEVLATPARVRHRLAHLAVTAPLAAPLRVSEQVAQALMHAEVVHGREARLQLAAAVHVLCLDEARCAAARTTLIRVPERLVHHGVQPTGHFGVVLRFATLGAEADVAQEVGVRPHMQHNSDDAQRQAARQVALWHHSAFNLQVRIEGLVAVWMLARLQLQQHKAILVQRVLAPGVQRHVSERLPLANQAIARRRGHCCGGSGCSGGFGCSFKACS